MPKYKVTYTFEVEVEAPNESIATINADYVLDNDESEPYMWDYLIKREAIELETPKELRNDFKKGDTKCTCTKCLINDICMYAWKSYNKNDNCLYDNRLMLNR